MTLQPCRQTVFRYVTVFVLTTGLPAALLGQLAPGAWADQPAGGSSVIFAQSARHAVSAHSARLRPVGLRRGKLHAPYHDIEWGQGASTPNPRPPVPGPDPDHRLVSSGRRPQQDVPAMRGRLAIDGRRFVYPDGRQFHWRGVTAFRLLDYVADGDEGKADAFLQWARVNGFNLVRVLGSLCCWFDLKPEAAQAALPRLLEMAARRDLYVEVVALAGTRMRGFDIEQHVRATGEICGRAENCLVQIANEPYHPTQDPRLSRTAYLQYLAGLLPDRVVYTLGASAHDKAHEPGGEYVTRHLSRGGEVWKMAARVRDFELLSAETGKPVVSGEPIGAYEAVQAERRSDDPVIFFAFGILGRLFDVGTTFHMEDGLHTVVPRENQQRCAEAFIEGTRLIPDNVRPEFQNATWPTSPVRSARFGRDVWKVYSGVSGSQGWTVALGLRRDPGIVWANGWEPTGVIAEKPGIRVYAITRLP